jgi:16S rRNA (adenine1518-N6/adenine1519-N6)-dimethyltransferase
VRYSDAGRILSEIGVRPDKRLGQSFLLNGVIASRIAAEAVPEEGGPLLEVGPGLGALTDELLSRVHALTAVEISRKMCDYLAERYPADRTDFICGDFLETDPSLLPGYPFEVVTGNLPYSISSPVLFRLLEPGFSSVRKAVFMLQKEMAARVIALEGGKDYGKLSLQIWPVYSASVLLDAASGDFYPPPKVDSRVIVLKRRNEPLVEPGLFEGYRSLVRISFASRRKTILNNLAPVFGREKAAGLLETAGVKSGTRAEQMPPEAFIRLSEAVST